MTQVKEAERGTPEEINREIRERLALINQMVGTFWPQVLQEQIIELRFAYRDRFARYDYA